MSRVDEELIRRFHRAERPVGSGGLFEGLARRRRRRRTLQRVQAGALAVAVLAGTAGGFVALRAAFDDRGRTPGEPTPLPGSGRIVFSSDVEQKGQSSVHLFSMEPDISAPMQLTEGYSGNHSPAVSPDGRTIAFTHELYDAQEVVIATMTIDGSPPAWLTDPELEASSPTWSPDGTKIAFVGLDGDVQRIFVMNADGSDPHSITRDDVFLPGDPAWSPDSRRIAFRGSPTPPPSGEGPLRWDIYTVEPDGGVLTNVTDSIALESEPSWSPDGHQIAYTHHGLDQPQDIVIRRLSDGTETFLTNGPEHDAAPAWSPDGRYIVFDRWIDNGQPHLWRVRPDGGELTRLTRETAYGAAWQPLLQTAGSVTPVISPSPDPEGREIGLGFNLCNVERLAGIDFLGDGANGQAWTGTPAKETGLCPDQDNFLTYLVAADVDGDGAADTVSETIPDCFFCQPYGAADLDADGDEELVVLWSGGSTPSFMIYAIADGEIAPVLLAEPGHPEARAEPGQPLTFATGGDEGYSGWVRCENFPAAPVLVVTWRDHPIEGDTMEVHETRFVLEDDGLFHVVGTNDYSAPVGQQIPGVTDEPACGVDFQLLG